MFVWLILSIIFFIALPYFAPQTATKLFIKIERYRAGLVRKEIILADGFSYAYLEAGRANR